MNQRAEDRNYLMDGNFLLFVGMTESEDHTSLIGALCRQISRKLVRGGFLETQGLPIVYVPSAREARRLLPEQMVVRGSVKNGFSLFSASIASALGGEAGRGAILERRRESRHG